MPASDATAVRFSPVENVFCGTFELNVEATLVLRTLQSHRLPHGFKGARFIASVPDCRPESVSCRGSSRATHCRGLMPRSHAAVRRSALSRLRGTCACDSHRRPECNRRRRVGAKYFLACSTLHGEGLFSSRRTSFVRGSHHASLCACVFWHLTPHPLRNGTTEFFTHFWKHIQISPKWTPN